ncbi:unnamed protein product [Spirodela intermedia]|uniref:Uncharacterized protein n=1 Tax=Spirodela intermedia TaxID=51605 RepID=A0A7I8JQS3_SPIIN|nr:unnamed protein product [Spirodela intermedia]CAA6672529.1 unnamed protein product [Spirodela intermedia]
MNSGKINNVSLLQIRKNNAWKFLQHEERLQKDFYGP